MSEPSFHTAQLNGWLQRIKSGDAAARDELCRAIAVRLERMARRMLARYPAVSRWEDTDDVLQNAVVRLLRTIEQVDVTSTRHFLNLAAQQIGRELTDLWRHYSGPRGLGANMAQASMIDDGRAFEPAADEEPMEDLMDWGRLHEEVERLPVEEREVVGLTLYHGWKQEQIAELFEIDVRTVRRRYLRALTKLNAALHGKSSE